MEEPYRTIVLLREVCKPRCSFEEIANRLGVSLDSIKAVHDWYIANRAPIKIREKS